jgi:WbqC-like protein family
MTAVPQPPLQMKLGMNQPYLFPYLGFYQLVAAVDRFIVYDNLNYIQYGWINRNRFLVVGGEPTYFNALTHDSSPNRKIREIKLSARSNWRRKLLNTFFLNYKKCPFFDETYTLIEPIIRSDTDSLSEMATASIVQVSSHVGIDTEIIENPVYDDLESQLESEQLETAFPSIKLERPERKVFRVIAVCHLMKASRFINAIGGQTLYDKDEFRRNGIELEFLKSRDTPYPQTTETFHPGLSIIDVLMNCGREGTMFRLKNYELI